MGGHPNNFLFFKSFYKLLKVKIFFKSVYSNTIAFHHKKEFFCREKCLDVYAIIKVYYKLLKLFGMHACVVALGNCVIQ